MNHSPPKWPLRILRWFCKDEFLDEIEGDIVELYGQRATRSRTKANLFLIWNVVRSFRWVNMKNSRMKFGLTKNYFKVGMRAMIRDWQFSLINLFGLSAGLAVFLTIILLVQHELSFDTFHTKADRIYQVIQRFQNADGEDPEIWTSWQLAGALRREVDIVENAVTIHAVSSTWASAAGKRFFEEDGIVVGPEFLQMFDFDLVRGNPKNALAGQRAILLTETMAKKYFEFENPIGQEIDLEFYGRFTVTGVLKDIPRNSYIQFNFIITQDYDVFLQTVSENFRKYFYSWNGDPVATYVLLQDPKDAVLFEEKAARMLEKYLDEADANPHYLLGLKDLHFGSNGIDGRINEYVKGDFGKVQFLVIVAAIILLMACFNYISISTARYIKRTKEVGVRKAMGAQRHQVRTQFMIESFLIVLFSSLCGLGLTHVMLPYFDMITGIQLALTSSVLLSLLPYFVGTLLLVTLLAGFYPALHLARYPIVHVLKNMTSSNGERGGLRKALVTVQYFFVMVILAGLLIVNKQYAFMSHQPLGFETEQLMIVEINSGGVRENYEQMKEELLGIPDVQQVTGLTRMISGYRSGTAVEGSLASHPDEKAPMRFYGMDEDGFETLGLQLVAGQGFSGVQVQDQGSVWLNETAAQRYGGEAVIGRYLKLEELGDDSHQVRVAGIVRDFHYRSLRKSIGAVVIGHYNNPFVSLDDIVIQLSGFNTTATMERIESIHNRHDTNKVMTWEFMDDMVQRAYEKELIFRNIFVGASVVSFLVALLGLIGLSLYSVVSKRKETAIRKVLGASFFALLQQHTNEFIRFLLLAAAAAIPVSWWMATLWLTNFEFRIDVSPQIFVGIVGFVLLVSVSVMLAVGSKSIRSNPVQSIRYE